MTRSLTPRYGVFLAFLLGFGAWTLPDSAGVQPDLKPDSTLPADWVKGLHWRCVGPANMSGRITAISVFEADPSTYYVATASGGLVKTTNNGVNFEHQFDKEKTVSIGDVCVAPPTATSSGSAPARPTRATPSPTATASTNRPTAANRGRTWASTRPSRSAAS
jgi:hypothetical protein